MSTEELGLILVGLSFLFLLVRSAIDAWHHHDALRLVRDLADGLTANVPLKDTVEARYLALSPDQRRYADQAFDLVNWLVKLTPTTADDKLAQWTGEVRDGLPNVPGEQIPPASDQASG